MSKIFEFAMKHPFCTYLIASSIVDVARKGLNVIDNAQYNHYCHKSNIKSVRDNNGVMVPDGSKYIEEDYSVKITPPVDINTNEEEKEESTND